jgi:hypothetical protein
MMISFSKSSIIINNSRLILAQVEFGSLFEIGEQLAKYSVGDCHVNLRKADQGILTGLDRVFE